MKSEFDREIDWLLRGHREKARRSGASPARDVDASDADAHGNGYESPHDAAQTSAHLDADELSAYAENALPPATRALYVAHLADCDQCRKIATTITLASGVAVELEKSHATATQTIATPSTWKTWLASIFSPRVLRYAAPALALLMVGAVAFVAWRQQSKGDFIARNQEARAPAPVANTDMTTSTVEQKSAETQTPPGDVGLIAPPTTDATTTTTTTAPVQNKDTAAAPTTAATGNADAAPSGLSAPSAEQARSEGAGANMTTPAETAEMAAKATREDTENRAPAPASATVAKQVPPPPRAEKEETADRDTVANATSNTTIFTDETRKRRDDSTASRAAGAPAARAGGGDKSDDRQQQYEPPPSYQRSQRARAKSPQVLRRGQTAADSEPEAETRSVGGRGFRRQDGAWVDTAYRSGQATTNVRRGSEQFRALVADEPDLRRIADQLGGEIIVVWRGRAYRIR
ncbi:MAG TPA: zf-HC2 domain-containing protein [Pyrinomonadaceae bacterium]|jgi:hypothetical protein